MKCKRGNLLVLGVVSIIGLVTGAAEADIVGLWEFDFGTAYDSCGDNHGSLVGNPSWETGRIRGALLFNGDDYVRLPNESDFDFTDAITVACWIKVKEFNQPLRVVLSKDTWRLVRPINTNGLAFFCTGPTSKEVGRLDNQGVAGDVNVNDAQWHHAAGVYDGSTIFLYVDGVLDKSANLSGKIDNTDYMVCVGRSAHPGKKPRYFNGLIDDVAIFDHALSENEIAQLCKLGGASFIQKGYMDQLVEEAETVVKKSGPQEAVDFLEKKIVEYRQWKAMNPNNIKPRDKQLSSEVYFLLAKAKEAAGLPRQDVVAAYKRSVSQVSRRTNHVPAALLWLYENVPADDYVSIVDQFVRNTNVLAHNICHVTRHYESNKNWAAFKLFLDGTFSAVESTERRAHLYAKVAGSSLEQNGAWVAKFEEYWRDRPELTTYLYRKQEETAEEYAAQQNFEKAAEIYRDIISRCGPNQRRAIYEFNVCECLLKGGQYESAVSEIDNFVKANKATDAALVRKALVLKGRAYLQMGEINHAGDVFLALMVEHPEVKEAPEASFFVGYCYMLQGKFDEATEAFNIVVKDYPESSYVDKARSYVSRIKSMTE